MDRARPNARMPERQRCRLLRILIVARQTKPDAMTAPKTVRIWNERDSISRGHADGHGIEASAWQDGRSKATRRLIDNAECRSQVTGRDVDRRASGIDILENCDECGVGSG